MIMESTLKKLLDKNTEQEIYDTLIRIADADVTLDDVRHAWAKAKYYEAHPSSFLLDTVASHANDRAIDKTKKYIEQEYDVFATGGIYGSNMTLSFDTNAVNLIDKESEETIPATVTLGEVSFDRNSPEYTNGILSQPYEDKVTLDIYNSLRDKYSPYDDYPKKCELFDELDKLSDEMDNGEYVELE